MLAKAEGLGFINTEIDTQNEITNSHLSIAQLNNQSLEVNPLPQSNAEFNNDSNNGSVLSILEFLKRKKKSKTQAKLNSSKKSMCIQKYQEVIDLKDKTSETFLGVSIDYRL